MTGLYLTTPFSNLNVGTLASKDTSIQACDRPPQHSHRQQHVLWLKTRLLTSSQKCDDVLLSALAEGASLWLLRRQGGQVKHTVNTTPRPVSRMNCSMMSSTASTQSSPAAFSCTPTHPRQRTFTHADLDTSCAPSNVPGLMIQEACEMWFRRMNLARPVLFRLADGIDRHCRARQQTMGNCT